MDFLTGGVSLKKKDTIIAVLLVILIVILFVGGQYKSNREEFIKERWENYTGNSRQTILGDFVDRTSVAGLTKAEITEMLGTADDEAEDFMIYFLGMPRGLFGTKAEGEDEFLLFRFTDGKVSQLEKVTLAGLPKESSYRISFSPPSEDGIIRPNGSQVLEGGSTQ